MRRGLSRNGNIFECFADLLFLSCQKRVGLRSNSTVITNLRQWADVGIRPYKYRIGDAHSISTTE